MSTNTGLAAVAAATTASITQAQHEAALAAARSEGVAAGRTEGEAAGRTAGAEAERARILGIEAHALKGHENLVASCKADPTCTPDMAAGRILAAEKALRENQAAGVAAVETHTGKVGAAAASDRRAADIPAGQGGTKATTPEGWSAEYKASAHLQAEYPSEAVYVAAMKAESGGKVRYLRKG
jgi:hypothetical protein